LIPDHYKILGVMPGADDAVIRAAYRALMRTYHPDRNDDPQAHARVRQITAAFAVLRDPGKRAAYDAERFTQTERIWLAPDRRSGSPPPMRRLGIASIVIALAMTLAFAMRPQWLAGLAPQPPRTIFAYSNKKAPALPVKEVTQALSVAPQIAKIPDEPTAAVQAAPVPAPARVEQPDNPPLPTPARHIAPSELPQSPAPLPMVAEQHVATPAPQAPTAPPCREGYSRGADGKCSNDRLAQVEGIAAGFLKQSMEHADWHKQQLLLSASNRTKNSRILCQSDECVTRAYLREMRDITTIMQGQIPNP
jgi:hypothetical protein